MNDLTIQPVSQPLASYTITLKSSNASYLAYFSFTLHFCSLRLYDYFSTPKNFRQYSFLTQTERSLRSLSQHQGYWIFICIIFGRLRLLTLLLGQSVFGHQHIASLRKIQMNYPCTVLFHLFKCKLIELDLIWTLQLLAWLLRNFGLLMQWAVLLNHFCLLNYIKIIYKILV